MAEPVKKCFEYETFYEGEQKILKISCEGCSFLPAVEDSASCFSKVIEVLLEVSGVTVLILSQRRDYEYDQTAVQLLNEVARLYKKLNQEERDQHTIFVTDPLQEPFLRTVYTEYQKIISHTFKEDPVAAYVELRRLQRREKIKSDHVLEARQRDSQHRFLSVVQQTITQLEGLQLIARLLPYLPDYQLGERAIYKNIFQPMTKPDFMYTKLIAEYPEGDLVESYSFGDDEEKSDVTLFAMYDSVKTMYHLLPPEYQLDEEKYELLDAAKRIMAEHKPSRQEFVNPQRMREVFYTIGKDLLADLATARKLTVREKELKQLAKILLRYTVGLGLVETLLTDPKIQDVNVNSPNGELPLFVVHQDYGDCYTNIYPTPAEVESWATKLRLISGRPLDEANPILDTELEVAGFRSRVAAVTAPLNPSGLCFSFRRHRDSPWTFPLYLKVGMMNKMAAGLLSFLIDNNATLLVAGTRSSGKTSLLGSFLTELMRRYRVITIEDTLELPTQALRELGYNIESLKVASALAAPGTEVDASVGIRSTLRLGDSALIIGEVRSKEAIALYEAMRVGAAANVVAGTIHAASPYGVYDRVVNDIGVPKTSFKATDIIIQTNPVRSASGLKKYKRILSLTEVRKEWEDDPLKENAFVDLMTYDTQTDQLKVSDDLRNGDSDILKTMAGNIREFAGDWDAVWSNIQLRGEVKQAIVDAAVQAGDNTLLEAPFVVKCNDMFHLLSDKVKEEVGSLDPKRILFDYQDWLRKEVKKKGLS